MKFPVDSIRRRRAIVQAVAEPANRSRRRIDAYDATTGRPTTMISIEVRYYGNLTRRQKRALCEDVIRRIELRLPDLLRVSDVTYRESSERVCVLLPDTSSDEAQIVVDRIRRAMDMELLPTTATVAIELTTAGGPAS